MNSGKEKRADAGSDGRLLSLLKRRKTGLMRLVFSRVGILLLLLVLEAVMMFSFFNWLNEYFEWFAVFQWVFGGAMIVRLFLTDMDSTSKLTWFFLFALFPFPTSILFLVKQQYYGERHFIERMKNAILESREHLVQDPKILETPCLAESGTDALSRYLNLSGDFPIFSNTETTFFPLGERKFEAMIIELEKAEHFIFMEYFIIDEGYMWGRILKILEEKAKAGVEVRVMYDGMCELSTLSLDYTERMRKIGIQCKAFSPLRPFLSTRYNYRDHRKILVVDGKVAFNGGVNLADEYINRIERFGHWKDTAIMLKGDAVDSFTLMFLQMWSLTENGYKWDAYLKRPKPVSRSDGFVMPYCDCPLDEYRAGKTVYMDILNRAKRYVYIMTPYLILDNELETALKFAAQRGVDVRLILPGIPDKKAPYAIAKTFYPYLFHAGVKIYEYTPGFVHAKIFVCDDEKAVVGTINLDYRSLYHHYECATYLYQASCIKEIKADYLETLKACREVTLETMKNEKLYYKINGSFLKVFAPLM